MFESDEVARYLDCPCMSCWEKVNKYVDKAVRMAGGFGLFFSFTEVTRPDLITPTRRYCDPLGDYFLAESAAEPFG